MVDPVRSVGFVGLGDQGEPMAQRILEHGFDLHVFARRPEQAARLVEEGAVPAATIGELASRVDVLSVCVGDGAQVIDVCDAAVPSLRPGAIIAVHSTVHPDTCIGVAVRCASRNVEVVDAPVSGGRAKAFSGELAVMLGGSTAAVDRFRPIAETFGALVVHAGALGSGQLMKLVHNFLFTAQLGIAADTVHMLADLGLDVGQAMTVFARSTGSSRVAEMFVAAGCDHVFPRHQDGRARGAELLTKDIDLVDSIAAGRGYEWPTVIESAVRSGLAMAQRAGLAEG
jgi:3-hydroxyisobutyrate dehydrogenase